MSFGQQLSVFSKLAKNRSTLSCPPCGRNRQLLLMDREIGEMRKNFRKNVPVLSSLSPCRIFTRFDCLGEGAIEGRSEAAGDKGKGNRRGRWTAFASQQERAIVLVRELRRVPASDVNIPFNARLIKKRKKEGMSEWHSQMLSPRPLYRTHNKWRSASVVDA